MSQLKGLEKFHCFYQLSNFDYGYTNPALKRGEPSLVHTIMEHRKLPCTLKPDKNGTPIGTIDMRVTN
jgi:hypothetical protein